MWIIFLTQFVLNWIERVGNFLSVYGFPNLDIPVQMPLSVWLTHSSCMTRGGEWGSQECDSLCLEAQAQTSSDESQPESLLGPHWWLQLLGPDVGVTPQKSLEDVHRPDVPGDLGWDLSIPHSPGQHFSHWGWGRGSSHLLWWEQRLRTHGLASVPVRSWERISVTAHPVVRCCCPDSAASGWAAVMRTPLSPAASAASLPQGGCRSLTPSL